MYLRLPILFAGLVTYQSMSLIQLQALEVDESEFENITAPPRAGQEFEDAVTKAKVDLKLQEVNQAIEQGPFQASWASLDNYYQVPLWYEDAKFGIFIHWGVFSVPAFGSEWYPRNMYQPGSPEFKHHVATYGPQTTFGYKDFIPMFTGDKFDPNQWATLFREAGAKFVVPVAEHHDGFSMYANSFSEWNAVNMGPKRDVIGELSTSVRKHGLIFGLSSHRLEHWFFFDGGKRFDSDVQDPKYASLYGPAQPPYGAPNNEYLDNWLVRSCELVDRYHPQIVWFDWWIQQPAVKQYLQKFAAYYYNEAARRHEEVVINYKFSAFPKHAAVLDIERGELSAIRPIFWQTDTSVSKNSWGFVEQQNYKTAEEIIGDLVDIVSKNGALLLNIGPKPDGTIPDPEQQILKQLGGWLAVNGEAIYGTRPFKIFGEGPTQVVAGSFNDSKRPSFTGQDIRFTRNGNTLYAIALAWPGERLTIRSLASSSALVRGEVTDVSLLGNKGKLDWSRDQDGLTVHLPQQSPGKYAYTFKITGLTDIQNQD